MKRLMVSMLSRWVVMPPSSSFLEWINAETSSSERVKKLGMNELHKNSPNSIASFEKEVADNALLADALDLEITYLGNARTLNLSPIEGQDWLQLNAVSMAKCSDGVVHFRNCKIRRIELNADSPNFRIRLDGCWIKSIKFVGVSRKFINPVPSQMIDLVDCEIGYMDMESRCIGDLLVEKGCLLSIRCPSPESDPPFYGAVAFRNTYLPRTQAKYLNQRPQSYRNLRHHLQDLENHQLASEIHARELALESEDDSSRFNRFLSAMYRGISDYGSSTARPLLWWVLLMLGSAWIYAISDGVALVTDVDSTIYVGYRESLVGGYSENQLARGVVLAVQQAFNPFGIFGAKSLLVPRTPTITIFALVQSILSTVLIALFIFAVRRRFRLQS